MNLSRIYTGQVFPNVEGTDLPDLEAAKQEAVRALVEITKDKLPQLVR
ncbi:hypothetical protein [Mesorhizobium sp. M0701]